MYSLLIDHFSSNSSENFDTLCSNYIKYFYPALNFIEKSTRSKSLPLFLSFILSAFFGLTILIIWVYIRLLIDKKKLNILLWFLDIPIPYVTYLSDHCDKYLKAFMDNKELSEKGINFDNVERFSEEYVE